MLEFTYAFGIVSLFLLFLYFKLDSEHKRFEAENAAYATPFVDQLFKFMCLALAVMALFVMFYFAMLGDVPKTITIANNVTNFTSYSMNVNGPNALNITNQTLPVISNFTRIETTSFTQGQINFITGIFSIQNWVTFLIGTIFFVTLIVRAVQGFQLKAKKKQEGDYD